MDSRIPAANGADIFFAVAVVFFSVYVLLPWEGGVQASIVTLLIVWFYTLPNLGAINARSRVWRIIWTIPAVPGNLAYLVFAVRFLSDFSEPLSGLLGLILPGLVILNSATMIVAFRLRRNQSNVKISEPQN